MKLLYLGFNRQYVNRTTSVLLSALAQSHDLSFYGPGYVSESDLARGPEAWFDREGPFGVVLFDSYVLEWDAISKRSKPFTGDLLRFPPVEFYRHGPALRKFAIAVQVPKIFIANWDTYGLSSVQTDMVLQAGCLVLDSQMGKWTTAEKADLFGHHVPTSGGAGFMAARTTDTWIQFLRKYPELVLRLPHAIGRDQFCATPSAERRFRFAVPGTTYPERRSVYPLMSRRQRAIKLMHKIQDRLYFSHASSLTPEKMRSIHSRYDREIASAQLCYVSGWYFRSPVRKYFEVPALGAAPIGQPCEGFEEMGFRRDHSFIVAESYEDVREALKHLPVDVIQRIADRARQLVADRHSEEARASQLADSVRRIAARQFKGSYWNDGDYYHR